MTRESASRLAVALAFVLAFALAATLAILLDWPRFDPVPGE